MTLKNKFLKEAVSFAHKNDLEIIVPVRGRYSVKALVETLKVIRSNLVLLQNANGKQHCSYLKTDDAFLVLGIRAIVDERRTYGYRRVSSLLKRERQSQELLTLNHKRLCRLVSQIGLRLAE